MRRMKPTLITTILTCIACGSIIHAVEHEFNRGLHRDLEEENNYYDDYYYYYEDALTDEELNVCKEETFKVDLALDKMADYEVLRKEIEESGHNHETLSAHVVVGSTDLRQKFYKVCNEAGGQMISASVIQKDDCSEPGQNYIGYPICISDKCEGDMTSAVNVVNEVIKENLQVFPVCTPEIELLFVSSEEDVEDDDDAANDRDTGNNLNNMNDTHDEDDHRIDETDTLNEEDDHDGDSSVDMTSTCYLGMAVMLSSGLLSAQTISLMAYIVDAQTDITTVIYNNNSTALDAFTESCGNYDGRLVLGNIMYDDQCVSSESRQPNFMDFPFCIVQSCSDEEAEQVLEAMYNMNPVQQCRADVDILGTFVPRETNESNTEIPSPSPSSAPIRTPTRSPTGSPTASPTINPTTAAPTNTASTRIGKRTKIFKGAKTSATSKKTKGVESSASLANSKSAKRYNSSRSKKLSKGAKYDMKDRTSSLQCTVGMTSILGNQIGIDPRPDRTFVLSNMMECTQEETSPELMCFYNGNDEALEEYTTDCNGRVVHTMWIFADGCDRNEYPDYWLDIPECIASSCNDEEAMDFLESIYFDPNDTSCYADISIADLQPALSTNKHKTKTTKTAVVKTYKTKTRKSH